MESEGESYLVRRCIEVACKNKDYVDKWRMQRRSLERLPSPLADSLLRHLLLRRLLSPCLLEVFKLSVEVIDLRRENAVDAEWMAYIGSFRYLRYLNLSNCSRITSSALWCLSGMTSLKELDLSRCGKVTDAAIDHILSIPTLEVLRISETKVSANGVARLSSLTNLSVLDLGNLPVTDMALNSLQVLTKLEHLDLWGSRVTDLGFPLLQYFPTLKFLNLAWTDVTMVPNIASLECLNMNYCLINYVQEGDGEKASLAKLNLSGASFIHEDDVFLAIDTSSLSHLDVSHSSLHKFSVLSHMKNLEYLDLSNTLILDDSIEVIASIGEKLKILNLTKTKITSAGIATLVGHVPKLEELSLSHTKIDDLALSYVGMLASLKKVDLSHTEIKGFIYQIGGELGLIFSLVPLQGLHGLERLNLEHTKVSDAELEPLSRFPNLSHLYLRSGYLTDLCLPHLSSLSKLTSLGIRDSVLTDSGLASFRCPTTLRTLDLQGCWLLTQVAMSSFCEKHPSIEVQHELYTASSQDQQYSSCSSPLQTASRSSPLNRMQGKMVGSWPASQHIIDQRMKYAREELLAFQYSSLSITPPNKENDALDTLWSI